MSDATRMVRLFKCKTCGARMFEQDTSGHAERHGFTNPLRDIAMYFIRGKKADTPSRPGINGPHSYRRSKKSPS